MSVNVHVVLFKSVSETELNSSEDVYSRVLESAGYSVSLVPVIDFQFFNLKEFSDKIKRYNDYEGLIFSSPRCVTAFELAIQNDNQLIQLWKHQKNYVVGEGTYKSADKLGLIVTGQQAGNGQALAEIIGKGSFTKPFLYPVSSLTQRHVQKPLENLGVKLDALTVYKTKPHESLNDNINKLQTEMNEKGAKSTFFIYFSPSGVDFSIPIMRNCHLDLNNVQFVAIGPTTESQLVNHGCQVAKTCTQPNPESLLEAILELDQQTK